jgi:hypothetical protein
MAAPARTSGTHLLRFDLAYLRHEFSYSLLVPNALLDCSLLLFLQGLHVRKLALRLTQPNFVFLFPLLQLFLAGSALSNKAWVTNTCKGGYAGMPPAILARLPPASF